MKNITVVLYSNCVIDPTYKNVIWSGADMDKTITLGGASTSALTITSKYIIQNNSLCVDMDYGTFINGCYNYLSYQYGNGMIEYYFVVDVTPETEGLTRLYLRKDVWFTYINIAKLKNAMVEREHQKWKDSAGNFIFNLNPEPIELQSQPVIAKQTSMSKVAGSVMWAKVTVSPIPESQGLPGATDEVYVFFVPVAEDIGNFTYKVGEKVLSNTSSLKSHAYVQALELCPIVPFGYSVGGISGGVVPITLNNATTVTITYPMLNNNEDPTQPEPANNQRAEPITAVYCNDLSKSVVMGSIQGTKPTVTGVENAGNYPYNWRAEPKLYTHLFRKNCLYNTGTYIELMNEKLQSPKNVQADIMIGDTVMLKYWVPGYDGNVGSKFYAGEDNTPRYLPRFDVASNNALALNGNQIGYSLMAKSYNAFQSVTSSIIGGYSGYRDYNVMKEVSKGKFETVNKYSSFSPNADTGMHILNDYLATRGYFKDMLDRPASVINSNSTGAWEWKFRNGELIYEEQTYSDADLERASMFMYRYGYNAGNRLDTKVNLKKKTVFDYYKVSDIEISGIYNANDLLEFKQIFIAGTTIWHQKSLTTGSSAGWYILGNGNPDA